MKISVLDNSDKTTRICGDLEKEVCGVYTGDLLSWVMSHAEAGNIWVTIMSNINVVAVASLTECAAVVICEGVIPDDEVVKVADEKGVTLFTTELSSYEACLLVAEMISKNE